jgi:Flp pilus assembly protein TadD
MPTSAEGRKTEVEDAIPGRPGWREVSAAIGLVLLVGVAYALKIRGVSFESGGPEPSTQEGAMKAGLDALYSKNDPTTAVAQFRKVLAMNPTHYGATYQLAVALDRAGDPGEARVYWEKMLPMAQAARDEATLATVRTRLQRPPTPEDLQAEAMKAGLDALYAKKDLAAAAAQFRKVLSMNPMHYGATYQLAVALDRAGDREEATPLWRKVLEMAGTYHDEETANTARTRLAQRE